MNCNQVILNHYTVFNETKTVASAFFREIKVPLVYLLFSITVTLYVPYNVCIFLVLIFRFIVYWRVIFLNEISVRRVKIKITITCVI